jgi:hypothetical protein
MPRDDETAVVKVTARGLRKAEKIVQIQEKYIRELLQDTIGEVGLVGQEILQDLAPERTGRLKESIVVTGRNRSAYTPNIRIGVEGAVSDEGFSYLNVTRFGRRAVEARRTREGFRPGAGIGSARLARSYNIAAGAVGAQKRPFRRHMLRYSPGPPGTPSIYRFRARAYHPKADWVRLANDDIQTMADYAFQKLTKEIELVLTRGDTKPRKVTVQVASRSGKFR